ncbi:MAG: hypothetical protein EA397_07295 [Deltaproteobacteria bacterium]|nr:MAG: hypothetical protein EA397_07295 [Deltaproteobacteria bacterium]
MNTLSPPRPPVYNRYTTALARLVTGASLAGALVGCGPGPDETYVTAVIGRSGGTIEHPSAYVEVPAGALESDVTLVVTDLGPPDASDALSPLLAFAPHGLSFLVPVTVGIAVDQPDASIWWSQSREDFSVVQTEVEDGFATTTTASFSYAFAAERVDLESESDTSTGTGVDSASTTETATDATPLLPFAVELVWTSEVDLDLHLLYNSEELFERPGDACFCNPEPEWGPPGPQGNPEFYGNSTALGPEIIDLPTPVEGNYEIRVHRMVGHEDTEARVRFYVDGEIQESFNTPMNTDGDVWRVARFSYPGGVLTPIDSMEHTSLTDCFDP